MHEAAGGRTQQRLCGHGHAQVAVDEKLPHEFNSIRGSSVGFATGNDDCSGFDTAGCSVCSNDAVESGEERALRCRLRGGVELQR